MSEIPESFIQGSRAELLRFRNERIKVAYFSLDRHLHKALAELEFLINATPTGDSRNKLTEVNISLSETISAFQGVPNVW